MQLDIKNKQVIYVQNAKVHNGKSFHHSIVKYLALYLSKDIWTIFFLEILFFIFVVLSKIKDNSIF